MRTANIKERVNNNIISLLIVCAFFLIWEMLIRLNIADPFFVSQPSSIINDFVSIIISGEIFPHIKVTLYEAFSGLLIGSIGAIVFALVLGKFQKIAQILDPIIMSLYGIPKLTLAPLFILWFGLGIESKIFLAAVEVFFLVFFNTYAGYKNVDVDLVNAVKLMGAKEIQIMQKVILPSCVPWILTGIRAGFGVGLIGAIVGEYMGSDKGLGWMIQYSSGMCDITRVLTCILILIIVMGVLNYCLKLVEQKTLKWRPSIN